MKIRWFSLVLVLNFLKYVPINGDTYHYQVIRKICPSGTYHDPIKDKCRKVPGGGEMIKMNLDARCSCGFMGLMAHSKKSRYYYACRNDGVLTCMCKPKQHFSRIRLRCEERSQKEEGISHQIVDNIIDKYKCAMMNGIFENNLCLLPLVTTTTEPTLGLKSVEEADHNEITRLQNLLKYLTVLKTIDNHLRSFEESVEVTTPYVQIIVPLTTASPPVWSTSSEPKYLAPIEDEFADFKKVWDLDSAQAPKIIILPTAHPEVSGKSVVDPLPTVDGEVSGRSLDDSDSLSTVIPKVSTISLKVSTTTTEEPEASESSLGDSLLTTFNPVVSGRSLNDSDPATPPIVIEDSDNNIARSFSEDTTPSITTEIVTEDTTLPPTTTRKPEKRKIVNTVISPAYVEEYFEYFYEDDPDTIIRRSNTSFVEVSAKDFNQLDDNWEQIIEVTDADFVETTTMLDPSNFQTTDVSNQETTIMTTEYGSTELLSTTDITSTTDVTSKTTDTIDSTTEMVPVPLISKGPGDLNFNDFQEVEKKYFAEMTSTTTDAISTEFSATSTTDSVLSTTIDDLSTTRKMFQSALTSENPETTSTVLSTTTENIESTSTTEITSTVTIDPRFLDESSTTLIDQTSTTEFPSTTLITDPKIQYKNGQSTTTDPNIISTVTDETPTTEFTIATELLSSTIDLSESTIASTTENAVGPTTNAADARYLVGLQPTTSDASIPDEITTIDGQMIDDSTTVSSTTTDSTTIKTESTTFSETTTIAAKDSDSEEDLKSILSTTVTNSRLKTRANTEPTTLNPVSTSSSSPIEIDESLSAKIGPQAIISKQSPAVIAQSGEKKPQLFEYYYEYEEYAVDEDGLEIKSQIKGDKNNESKTRVLKKHRRDNSNEYYAESISASHERRSQVKKDYDYFY